MPTGHRQLIAMAMKWSKLNSLFLIVAHARVSCAVQQPVTGDGPSRFTSRLRIRRSTPHANVSTPRRLEHTRGSGRGLKEPSRRAYAATAGRSWYRGQAKTHLLEMIPLKIDHCISPPPRSSVEKHSGGGRQRKLATEPRHLLVPFGTLLSGSRLTTFLTMISRSASTGCGCRHQRFS